MSHNSRTEKPRTFKLSGGVEHVTRYRRSLTEVKRSKVKFTSQGQNAKKRPNGKAAGLERPLIVIGVGDSKYVIIFDPLCTGHVILRMCSGT